MSIAIASGMRLTPARLNALAPVWARKSADQTKTNSSTLSNDSALVLPVEANAEYDVEAKIFYEAPTANDFKFAFTWPSGASFPWGVLMQVNTSTGTSGSLAPFVFGNPTSGDFFVAGGGGAGNQLLLLIKGSLIMGGTAGNLQFQFAQSSAAAGTTAVCKAGSTLRLMRTA